MKRLIAVLLLITFFSLAATSQELTPRDEVLYEQLKLSVVVSSSKSIIKNYAQRSWQGFQGAKKISEEDFLSIAGLTNKASKAGGYKGVRTFFSIAGGISMGIGYGLGLLWSISLLHTADVKFPTSSIFLFGGGFALVIIGGPPNHITAEEAFSIAESYNANLRQRLLSSLPIK